MIHLFTIYQFIFLYIPILFIGMAVYGTDIKSTSGYCYIATILISSLLIFLLKKNKYPDIFIRLHKPIAFTGGLLALFLYRDLHFNFWDEHSLSQALLILGIGISSCLSSINSALLINKNIINSNSIFRAMALISATWLFAIYYPMIALFFIALILMVWPLFSTFKSNRLIQTTAPFSRYYVFIIFMDLPLIIWDFQVDSQWGLYISSSLLACALGLILPTSKKLLYFIGGLFLVNFLYCAIQAEIILNPLHSLISGFALGIYINYCSHQKAISFTLIPAIAAPAFVGFIFSLVFYSNLEIAIWRSLFVTPILLYFLNKAFRSKRSAQT